MRNWSVL